MCVGGGGGGAKSDNWNFHYQFGITASLQPAAHQGENVSAAATLSLAVVHVRASPSVPKKKCLVFQTSQNILEAEKRCNSNI